jgi:hypothetical protein
MIYDLEPFTPQTAPGYVREILDPVHTLPYVDFRLQDAEHYGDRNSICFDIFNDRDECIGEQYFATNADGSHYMRWVNINPLMRGRGLGLATYVLASEMAHQDGKPLDSSDELLVDGFKIWDTLIKRGVAEELQPFQLKIEVEEDELIYSYVGKARIPVVRP